MNRDYAAEFAIFHASRRSGSRTHSSTEATHYVIGQHVDDRHQQDQPVLCMGTRLRSSTSPPPMTPTGTTVLTFGEDCIGGPYELATTGAGSGASRSPWFAMTFRLAEGVRTTSALAGRSSSSRRRANRFLTSTSSPWVLGWALTFDDRAERLLFGTPSTIRGGSTAPALYDSALTPSRWDVSALKSPPTTTTRPPGPALPLGHRAYSPVPLLPDGAVCRGYLEGRPRNSTLTIWSPLPAL